MPNATLRASAIALPISTISRRAALAGALAAVPAAAVASVVPTPSAPGYRGPGLYLGWGLVSIVGEPELENWPACDGNFVPIVTIDKYGVAKRSFVVHDLFDEWGLTLVVPMRSDAVRDLAAYWGTPRAKAPDLRAAIAAHEAAQTRVYFAKGLDEDAFAEVVAAADEVLRDVVEIRCESDADFLAKAKYLLRHERRQWGGLASFDHPYGCVAEAVEQHLESRTFV